MEKIMNEEQLQAKCFQWHWNTYPQDRRMLFHIQQNMFGNAYRGSLNKAIGVVSGVSDMIHIGRAVLFLELKVRSNKQSPEQIDFENKVRARGFHYFVVTSLEQFMKIVKSNMYEEKGNS